MRDKNDEGDKSPVHTMSGLQKDISKDIYSLQDQHDTPTEIRI